MTLNYSRVTPAEPLWTLDEAKDRLKVTPVSDDDFGAMLAAAEEYVFAKLGAAADPSWDATTAPQVVRHAVLLMLDAFNERRGGDEGGELLQKAMVTVDFLLSLYRDVSVA
jgi:hypothetical protein